MNPCLIASTCLITQEQHCHMSTCHRAKILICFWAFYYVFHSPFFLARVLQLLGQAAEIPSISVLYIKTSIEISFTNILSFSQSFFGILLWNIYLQISFILPVRKVNFKYEENQMLLQHILRFVIFVSGPWKHNAIEICILLIHHNALFVTSLHILYRCLSFNSSVWETLTCLYGTNNPVQNIVRFLSVSDDCIICLENKNGFLL